MKTAKLKYQQLLNGIKGLLNAEEKISVVFNSIQTNISNTLVKEIVACEAEENLKHRMRLEGLLEVLNQNAPGSYASKTSWINFTQQFYTILNRVALRHNESGYKLTVYIAQITQQHKTAILLNSSVANMSKLLSENLYKCHGKEESKFHSRSNVHQQKLKVNHQPAELVM